MNPNPLGRELTDEEALREIAQNPEAFGKLMTEYLNTVLNMEHKLAILARATQAHCRATHVEGDRWLDARRRAYPVEKALNKVLSHVRGLRQGMETATHKRHAHEDRVKALPGERRQRALAKAQKKGTAAALQSPPQQQAAASQASPPHREPSSVFDIRRSA